MSVNFSSQKTFAQRMAQLGSEGKIGPSSGILALPNAENLLLGQKNISNNNSLTQFQANLSRSAMQQSLQQQQLHHNGIFNTLLNFQG